MAEEKKNPNVVEPQPCACGEAAVRLHPRSRICGRCDGILPTPEPIATEATVEMPEDFDPTNNHGVGVNGDQITVMLPAQRFVSKGKALAYIAWIAVLSDLTAAQVEEAMKRIVETS